MLWGENRGKWKGRQPPSFEPTTPLAWAASALPLSYGNWTTTNPHNPLYVLHRWHRMPQSHTWQPLSMCRQNSVRGQPENSLSGENPYWVALSHTELFFLILSVFFSCWVFFSHAEWFFSCWGVFLMLSGFSHAEWFYSLYVSMLLYRSWSNRNQLAWLLLHQLCSVCY